MRVAFHFIAIDHVQLAAPRGSEQTAKKFYAEILGFTEVENRQNWKNAAAAGFKTEKYKSISALKNLFYPPKKRILHLKSEISKAWKTGLPAIKLSGQKTASFQEQRVFTQLIHSETGSNF